MLEMTDGIAAEPNDPATIRFTTRGSGSGNLTIHYSVTGTASSGTDFQALSGSLVIGHQATKNLTLAPINDGIPEDLETVTITLEPDPGYTIAGVPTATLHLLDDEQSLVSVWPGQPEIGTEKDGITLASTSNAPATPAPHCSSATPCPAPPPMAATTNPCPA